MVIGVFAHFFKVVVLAADTKAFLAVNGSSKNQTVSVSDGFHNWSVTCWDYADNIDTLEFLLKLSE